MRRANGRTAERQFSATWWLQATPAEVARLSPSLVAERARLLGLAAPRLVAPTITTTMEVIRSGGDRAHVPSHLAAMVSSHIGYVLRGDVVTLVLLPDDGDDRTVTFTLCPRKIAAWRRTRSLR